MNLFQFLQVQKDLEEIALNKFSNGRDAILFYRELSRFQAVVDEFEGIRKKISQEVLISRGGVLDDADPMVQEANKKLQEIAYSLEMPNPSRVFPESFFEGIPLSPRQVYVLDLLGLLESTKEAKEKIEHVPD